MSRTSERNAGGTLPRATHTRTASLSASRSLRQNTSFRRRAAQSARKMSPMTPPTYAASMVYPDYLSEPKPPLRREPSEFRMPFSGSALVGTSVGSPPFSLVRRVGASGSAARWALRTLGARAISADIRRAAPAIEATGGVGAASRVAERRDAHPLVLMVNASAGTSTSDTLLDARTNRRVATNTFMRGGLSTTGASRHR